MFGLGGRGYLPENQHSFQRNKHEIFSAMAVYGFLTYHDGYVSIPNHELMLIIQGLLSGEDAE